MNAEVCKVVCESAQTFNWSDVLSVIAILVSVFAIYISMKQNRINLKSTFFLTIYSKHIFKKLPKCRNMLRFDNEGKLKDFSCLQEELIKVIKDSGMYSFIDEKYYRELKGKCQDLEEYLLTLANRNMVKIDKQVNAFNEMDRQLREIYKLLNKKYERG